MMYDNEGKEQLLLNDYSDWIFINISLSVADQHHHKFIVHIFCDCRRYLQVANELRKNIVLMYITLNYTRELTGYVCCYKVLCC